MQTWDDQQRAAIRKSKIIAGQSKILNLVNGTSSHQSATGQLQKRQSTGCEVPPGKRIRLQSNGAVPASAHSTFTKQRSTVPGPVVSQQKPHTITSATYSSARPPSQQKSHTSTSGQQYIQQKPPTAPAMNHVSNTCQRNLSMRPPQNTMIKQKNPEEIDLTGIIKKIRYLIIVIKIPFNFTNL